MVNRDRVRVIDRILRWAATQCAPLAETVAAELEKIDEARRVLAANKIRYEAERDRHDVALTAIVDEGLAIQRDCKHWDITVSTLVGDRLLAWETKCNTCGKRL